MRSGRSPTGAVFAQPTATTPTDATGTTAKMADAFIDTIGIGSSTWQYFAEIPIFEGIIVPSLVELGIRHSRDGLNHNYDDLIDRQKRLISLGIHLNLVTQPEQHTAAQARAVVDRLGGSPGVASVEGVNEPDGYWGSQPSNLGGLTAPQAATNHQQAVFTALAGTGISMLSSALINPDNVPSYTGQAPYSTASNGHPYSGRPPESTGWGPDGYGSIDWNKQYMGVNLVGSGKPHYATECGYHTCLSPNSANAGRIGVSEAIQAIYEPRMFLHFFNHDIKRTFKFTLMEGGFNPNTGTNFTDEAEPDQKYGWVKRDGTKKPAFVAMKNMMRALADPGPTFTPGKLNFTLSGSTSDVNTCLLQKRNGQWFLMIWLGLSISDPDSHADIAVNDQSVTVTFTRALSAAAINIPNDNATFSPQTITANAIAVTVRSKVTILRLTP